MADTRVDEQRIAAAWEAQAFDARAFPNLSVIFRGVPSDAGGPDYQDAVLVTAGGEIIRGDVEFHVRSSDWFRHDHHVNPAYNRVVLHVVWECDDLLTERQDGMPVPRLSLSVVGQDLPPAPEATCLGAMAARDIGEIEACLHELALKRLRSRAARFDGELSFRDCDQVLWSALLESMGYASNRSTFRALAEAAPIAWLRAYPPHQWERLLLSAAGLSGDADSSPAHLAPDAWRLARLRPANHPSLRISGVCRVWQALEPDPVVTLTSAVESSRPVQSLRALLCARSTSDTFIGRGRADEIAVSVVLPFVLGAGGRADVVEHLYARYPPPPANRWTRLMTDRLRGAGHHFRVHNAAQHQGMHALYHDHCRPIRRRTCPMCGTEQGSPK